MGFFDKIGEKLRDKTRDRLCAALCAMGIDARLAERDRVEEEFGGKGSIGLIEIPEGPIRWVNVRKRGDNGPTHYYTDYGVPDPRLEPDSQEPFMHSVREKTFLGFGQVVDVQWEGEDWGTGVIHRLNSDHQLKHPIMESHDVKIEAIGDYGCWIMSTQTRDVPSGELWNCYQVIAQHLLTDWPSG